MHALFPLKTARTRTLHAQAVHPSNVATDKAWGFTITLVNKD